LLDLRPMFALNADATLRYAVVVKHGIGGLVLVDTVPEIRTLSKDQILTGSDRHGEGISLCVDGGQTRGPVTRVLETSAVLSHFEGAG
jgi:chemotaxis signal transduction protein